MTLMDTLRQSLPQSGHLESILLRPGKGLSVKRVEMANLLPGKGLEGDRFSGRVNSKRQVTLIQAENLEVIAALLHRQKIDPVLLRRNLVVRGISVNGLKGNQFRIGEVILEGTEYCHPCSKMEEVLGPGGFNAMRGIGGLCARVLHGGTIQLGDKVCIA